MIQRYLIKKIYAEPNKNPDIEFTGIFIFES